MEIAQGSKQKRIIIDLIIILLIIIVGGFFYFIIKNPQPIEPLPIEEPYSYRNIIYNFWGFVTDKQAGILTIEGVSPQRMSKENLRETEAVQTVKFSFNQQTKIVKKDREGEQSFIDFETIQIGDHLALKTDQNIDQATIQVMTNDILLLPALPLSVNPTTSR